MFLAKNNDGHLPLMLGVTSGLHIQYTLMCHFA